MELVWDWVSIPRGRSRGELGGLLESLHNVSLSQNRRDSWGWTHDDEGIFKVKTLSRIVNLKCLKTGAGSQETIWCLKK